MLMNSIKWTFLTLAAISLAFTGCKKSEAPSSGNAQTIDATQFRPPFASASPEVQATVDKGMTSMQASMYMETLAALDKLANDASLTEPQQKAVKDLIEQVKKKMAAVAGPPGQ